MGVNRCVSRVSWARRSGYEHASAGVPWAFTWVLFCVVCVCTSKVVVSKLSSPGVISLPSMGASAVGLPMSNPDQI